MSDERMAFEVDLRAIYALVPLASKNDIRWYLNSVCVQFTPEKTLYAATNGDVLGCIERESTNAHTASIIIPLDAAKRIKLGSVRSPTMHGQLLTGGKAVDGKAPPSVLRNQSLDIGIEFEPIEAHYPTIARVIERVQGVRGGVAADYDVTQLAAFADVNKRLGAAKPGHVRLLQNGPDRPGRVELPMFADFIGAIQPVKAT